MIERPSAVRIRIAVAIFQYMSGTFSSKASMPTGAVKRIPESTASTLVTKAKRVMVSECCAPTRSRSCAQRITRRVITITNSDFQKISQSSEYGLYGVIQMTIISRPRMYAFAMSATGAYQSDFCSRRVSSAVKITNTANSANVENTRSNLPWKSPMKSREMEATVRPASRMMLTFRKVESLRCGAPARSACWAGRCCACCGAWRAPSGEYDGAGACSLCCGTGVWPDA